jgi:hypothetical protein
LNLDTMLDHFRTISEYSKLYTLKEAEFNGKKVITLAHQFGQKGSICLQEVVVALLELVNVKPADITCTENSVSFSL